MTLQRGSIGVRIASAMLLPVLLAATGCGGLETAIRYPGSGSGATAAVQTVAGITVAVDPLMDQVRAKEIFDREPERLGILAIHIVVENRRPSSLLLQKSSMGLSCPGRAGGIPTDAGGDIATRNYSAGERTVFALMGFLLGSGGIAEHDVRANHNFAREELRDTMLRPGQTAQGCVYFRVSQGQDIQGARLEISLLDMETRTPTVLVFTLQEIGEKHREAQ